MADECYSEPLNIPSSTVLITGGSSGIGLGFARCFVQAGAAVIITGRREQPLKEAAEELNRIGKKKVVFRVNDTEKLAERQALYEWIIHEYPQTNILINNAGIQQRASFIPNEIPSENISWEEREKEIQINVCAPMHLCHLFIQHFRQMKTTTAIMNVSSGLAFVPLAGIPIYSATKAAVHSFTMSLRYQLMNEIKNIQVYEIVPPAVQTNLGGSHAFGESLVEYCQATFERLQKGQQEIGYKFSDEGRKMKSREDADKYFKNFNDNMIKLFQNQQL
ncbi:unnamed protein product [Rotaria magnacalcarata]|uniref:Uncharacterized protein n=1 Tax=Rotaria magnacalcarata TaxID=392030 RepID=A0A816MJI7_9BILA|nr:unnamed protein product [Rotaria magnacalcarata]CAF1551115.1 unnamed protein product [Rotaria magnacalcarata]CAF1930046.1 unnamed protein product [Rotaria magnacalcarata]CAF1957007.1 unnamed protein product [Rotaria magnacalcarata]CAF1984091.1 unnamed protein product [Rotaria magnacalcarata]